MQSYLSMTHFSEKNSPSAVFICSAELSLGSQSGKRYSHLHIPRRDAAYLIPTGLTSENIAFIRGVRSLRSHPCRRERLSAEFDRRSRNIPSIRGIRKLFWQRGKDPHTPPLWPQYVPPRKVFARSE